MDSCSFGYVGLCDWLPWASESGEVPSFIRAIADAAFIADPSHRIIHHVEPHLHGTRTTSLKLAGLFGCDGSNARATGWKTVVLLHLDKRDPPHISLHVALGSRAKVERPQTGRAYRGVLSPSGHYMGVGLGIDWL